MNDDQHRAAFDDAFVGLSSSTALPPRTAARARRRRRLKGGATGAGAVGAVLAAAVLGLGALSPGPQTLGPASPPSPSAAPSAGPSSAPMSEEPQTSLRVTLRPDGLGFSDGGSSTSSLTFGADAASVRTALDRALGAGEEFSTPDCGTGSNSVQYEGLSVLLQDDTFVGWAAGSPGLTTGDGITVGATLAELRAALPDVQVSEGTVGAEWSVAGDGGLAGFLDGVQDTSAVTGITAGIRCIAR